MQGLASTHIPEIWAASCMPTYLPSDCVYSPTDLCSLMVNICSCELDSRRCKKSPSHFRFGRLSGSSYKPKKPRCSYGRVKGEGWKKHIHRICTGKKELESWKVETFQYAHSDMPAANRQLARTLFCAANMPPRGLSNKVSDECICSPLWKFMRAFVVRYVNFTEHSYFCNFHAYYIRNWDIGFSIGHSRNCSNTIRFMLGCLPYVHMFVCQPFSLQCEDLIIQKFKA